MRRIFFSVTSWILIVIPVTSIGQNKYTLPQITPQSPNAASLGKYGEIPVSLQNGIPNVSIPLLNVKVGSVNLNISLSYNNNGLKVDEIPSYVGLGWNLEAGGVITYEQRGNPDFSIDGVGMFTNTSIFHSQQQLDKYLNHQMTNQEEYDYLESVIRNDLDAQYDLYHYNFLGQSGSFYFDHDQNIICVPRNNLKITKEGEDFKIIDEKGNQFLFNIKEHNEMDPNDDFPARKPFDENAAYYLGQIITSENRVIGFGYAPTPFFYQRTNNYYSHFPGIKPFQECPSPSYATTGTNYTMANYLLNSISFDEGTIQLELSSDVRQDLKKLYVNNSIPYLKKVKLIGNLGNIINEYTLNYSYFGNNDRLRLDAVIHSNAGFNEEKWSFDYYEKDEVFPSFFAHSKDHWGYYNGANNVNGIPAADYNSFVFEWHPDAPTSANRSSNFLSARRGVLKTITYPTGGSTTLDYESNRVVFTNIAQITANPFLQFDPSGHVHYDGIVLENTDQQPEISGSFTLTSAKTVKIYATRMDDPYSFINSIVSLSTTPGGSNILLQQIGFQCSYNNCVADGSISLSAGTYYYYLNKNLYAEINDAGYASLGISEIVYDDLLPYNVGGVRIVSLENNDALGHSTIKYFSYSERIDSVYFRNIPYYMTVTNIKRNRPTGGGGGALLCDECGIESKIHDESVFPLVGNSVQYLYAKEMIGTDGKGGMTSYQFKAPTNLTADGSRPYVTPFLTTWRSGLPEHKTIYKNVNADFIPIQTENNNYTPDPLAESPTVGIKVDYFTHCEQEGINYRVLAVTHENYQTERFNLESSTSNYLSDAGSLTGNTFNTYLTSGHTLPIEVKNNNSKNEFVKSKTRFSFEYNTIYCNDAASIAVRNLKDRNVLVPIETLSIQTINGLDYVVAGTIVFYKQGNTVPSSVWQLSLAQPILLSSFIQSSISSSGVFIKDSHYEERAAFDLYDDFQNVLQEHYTGNIFNAYIYGYKSMYPIAEVKNSEYVQCAATSFESNATGKWTYNPAAVITTPAITGKLGYTLSPANPISMTGASPSRKYILSYWSKNGTYSVSGATIEQTKTGKTINQWTYYEQQINCSANSITLSGTGLIDELRVYPLVAQMTTYTFDPLVGITSLCDINNKIIYYEYDPFLRLKYIRNEDGYILKAFTYKFQEQQ